MKRYLSVLIIFLSQTFAEESKPFVIGSTSGGLGSQMFQVAATCAFAWDNGADPYFPSLAPRQSSADSSIYHVFHRCQINMPKDPITFEWMVSTYGYEPIFFQKNMRITGHAQNERYFAHHRNRLIQLFSPKECDLSHIKRNYQDILDHPNSVCVHVRYYYGEKPSEPEYRQYDEEYYEKAMSLFPDNALFVVISDNVNFARHVIPQENRNVVFIENEKYYIDFFLQTLCKHHIIANSAFSWWGAWLNQNPNKIVVRPEQWRGGHSDIGGPQSWIKVAAQSVHEKM